MATQISGDTGVSQVQDGTIAQTDLDTTNKALQAKAWVNFDGTGTIGVNCTIRSSYNVTSVYKAGTGDYLITFTTALADANYCVQYLTANDGTSVPVTGLDNATAQTTTQVRLASVNNTGARASSARNSVIVFGN